MYTTNPKSERFVMSFIKFASVGSALLVAVLTGCSGDSRVPVYPVTGKVTFDGKPASGAQVMLNATGEVPKDLALIGVVNDDGSFKISSYGDGDGAPAGEYVVTVQWFRVVQSEGGSGRGPNVVPPKYSTKEASPIKVTVNKAATEIPPIEVTK
jgi:hypothetical protein